MKKMNSKLSKMQRMGLALMVAVAMVSCDKEGDVSTQEPEFTQEELAEMAAADKFAAANSVYRALALIDELPDNWESATYDPAEGVPVDEANTDIRNVVSTDADQAKQYFLSIVPDLGLDGDIWSHEGVGTLTFRAVNEENCYAVIDVNLVQMPGLKELRFVPESVVGENKWQGTPYYAVGDVIKDKKKGIYWICVRPSGGPLAKDYAYFVSFDKSLIKTKEQKQDIYEVTGVGEDAKVGKTKVTANCGKWIYAKNLVEERIALAAAHVFAYLADAKRFNNLGYPGSLGFLNKYNLGSFEPELLGFYRVGQPREFYVAYGSYQSSGTKQCSQAKYIQPIFTFSLEHTSIRRTLQRVTKAWAVPGDPTTASSHLMSLTAGHDPLTYAYLNKSYTGYDKPYSILDYTIEYDPQSESLFSFLEDGATRPLFMPIEKGERLPIVMTQMSLKDHGKAASGYVNVIHELEPDEVEVPDYWLTIENSDRIIFEKGKETEKVAVPE
jgi:hypothetical protein